MPLTFPVLSLFYIQVSEPPKVPCRMGTVTCSANDIGHVSNNPVIWSPKTYPVNDSIIVIGFMNMNISMQQFIDSSELQNRKNIKQNC